MTERQRLAGIRRARARREKADEAARETREDIALLLLESAEAGDNMTMVAGAAGLTRAGLYWILNNRREGAA